MSGLFSPNGCGATKVTGRVVLKEQVVSCKVSTQDIEPSAECGWEGLRWGYERLRRSLKPRDYDVIVVHSPHWKTRQGHHVLACPAFQSLSVDPVFPNLFRFHYDLTVDVDLAHAVVAEGRASGLVMKPMTNPEFRVDYGTIIACHLVR